MKIDVNEFNAIVHVCFNIHKLLGNVLKKTV